MNEHDGYCPDFGKPYDHVGLCREQPGYPVQPAADPLYSDGLDEDAVDQAFADGWNEGYDVGARIRVAVFAVGFAVAVVIGILVDRLT